MSEQPDLTSAQNLPPSLSKLGAHFGKQVTAHVVHHEETSPRVERQKRIDDFRSTLEALRTCPLERDFRKTKNVHFETLDSGTYVSVSVGVEGAIGYKETLDEYAPDSKKLERGYLENGALSQEIPSDTILIEGQTQRGPLSIRHHGLNIYASLETPHLYGGGATTDQVFVGTLVDPKSMLVPVESDEPAPEELSLSSQES